MEKKVAVVTGALGFLGVHLCERLLSEGAVVLGYDNFVTGKKENLNFLKDNPNFRFFQKDVSEGMLEIEGAVDFVFHFASPASPLQYARFPLQTLKVGSFATHYLLELAREKGAVFVLASTSEVYGDPLEHPQSEGYYGNVNSFGSRSCYDEAKRYAEAVCYTYQKEFKLPIRIARIFNTYGPRMNLDDGRAVPSFIKQALSGEKIAIFGDGMQTRSFCYVDDLIEGIYRLSLSDVLGPVNLGNSTEFKILDFAKFLLKLAKSDSEIAFFPLQENDPLMRRPDLTRAMKELEWSPKISLKEGLGRTIEYFLSRRV